MALSASILQNDLFHIFDSMNRVYKNGEEYMATRCAEAIYTYISMGMVNTMDSGKGSIGGVYTGKGTGIMQISTSTLRNLFLNTLLTAKNNDEIASMLANNINSACSMQNIISTTTIGQTIIPPSPPTPDAGTGKGSFTSVPTIISSKLKICFTTMNRMRKGGNMYFAQEFASAIDSYVRSGVINVTLQPPMSGVGSGTIS